MSKRIKKQDITVRLGYFANGPMGVSSPMSKTRSKIGSKGNGGISPRCLRQLRSKASREVWNIEPMGQYELTDLCIRLVRSKTLSINEGIAPMCLK